jgi:hypothetical protein
MKCQYCKKPIEIFRRQDGIWIAECGCCESKSFCLGGLSEKHESDARRIQESQLPEKDAHNH